MRENRPRRTGRRLLATAIRVLLLSLMVGTLSCGGGGDGNIDGPTGPSDDGNFTEDTSVQGTVTLTELNVPAGVTITATGNLVCDIEGDIVIDGDLVGDCVEITVQGQGRLTVTGTIRNECSVPQATGQAPFLNINNKGDMSITGATIRSSGRIDLRNSSLGDPDFDGNPLDVPSPPGEPKAVMTIVNSTIEAGPGRALDGQDGPVGSQGATGSVVIIVVNGDLVLGGSTLIKSQDGGNGGNALHEGAPAFAEGGRGGFGGPMDILASGQIDFGTGSVTIESGRGGDGGSAIATALPGSGDRAPGAEAMGGSGESAGIMRILGIEGVKGGANARVRMGRSGAGGRAEATGLDGDPEQCTGLQAQAGGYATAAGGEGVSSPVEPMIFGASIVFDRDPAEGGEGGDGGESRATGGRGAEGSADCIHGGDGGTIGAWGGDGGDARTPDLQGNPAGEGGLGGGIVFEGGDGGNGFSACAPAGQGGDGGTGAGTVVGRAAIAGSGRSGSGSVATVTLNGVANGGNGGDGGGTEGGPGTPGAAGSDGIELRGAVRNETAPSFQPGQAGGQCS